jgi:cobalamin biosynthesis protein CobT
MRAVFRWEADRSAGARTPGPRLFERSEVPQIRHFAITLLVDLSGSMASERKIDEAFRAAVLLTETLSRLGVAFEVLGFQDELIVFKAFGDELSTSVRRKIAGMPAEVSGTNPGGHNEPAFNDDGPCLAAAARNLEAQAGRERFLLVLSDGVPAGKRSGDAELRGAVEEIMRTTSINLVGLGLGGGTEHVRDFYPVSVASVSTSELTARLGDLLEAIVAELDSFRSRREGRS